MYVVNEVYLVCASESASFEDWPKGSIRGLFVHGLFVWHIKLELCIFNGQLFRAGHIYIGIEVKLMSDRFNEQLDWAYLVLKWAYLYQIALNCPRVCSGILQDS